MQMQGVVVSYWLEYDIGVMCNACGVAERACLAPRGPGDHLADAVAVKGSVARLDGAKPLAGQPDSPAGLRFERDVRPMFREKDRHSMLKAIDLWSLSDVHAHQDAILERLRQGRMPCDRAWPTAGRRERLPVDVLGQQRFDEILVWLVLRIVSTRPGDGQNRYLDL